MKIAIIVFSPSGNTLKVGKMMESAFKNKGAKVQLIDSTRREMIFKQNNRAEFLDKNVSAHDVLMIGGPVYSHHMQYNLLELIKALPQPDEKWGSLAVPFTTFGTISSGEALAEAASLLRITGRKNVLGLKVDAYHCFSKKWDTKINEGMPGKEALPYIDELVTETLKLEGRNPETVKDISELFNYQSKSAMFKSNVLLKEKRMHKHVFPRVRFNYSKCESCKKCKKVCPVQCIEIKNELPMQANANACIHCAECFHTCPYDAIRLNIKRYKPFLIMGAKGKGFLTSHEMKKTEVFFNSSL